MHQMTQESSLGHGAAPARAGDVRTKHAVFLTDIPTPYRNVFYNVLAKICQIDVLFDRRTEASLVWSIDEPQVASADTARVDPAAPRPWPSGECARSRPPAAGVGPPRPQRPR
jgi:hypothetical protein